MITTDDRWPYAPRGHDGPCCPSCERDDEYVPGTMEPWCCCRDPRTYFEAYEQRNAWLRACAKDDEFASWLATTRPRSPVAR